MNAPAGEGAHRLSPLYLAKDQPLRRVPTYPEVAELPTFETGFEDRAVFYDIFRSLDGRHVYLIGPMALNLAPHIDAMSVTGLTSGHSPKVQVHHGWEATICRVRLPPEDTRLAVTIAGRRHEIDIQPNRAAVFAGKRVLVTMNRNNRLEWIADWVYFHVREHGADAVLIYDNNSDAYTPEDLHRVVSAVPGVDRTLIVPWPYRYGVFTREQTEKGHMMHRAMFAQPCMFTQCLRKYVARARSMLNVDVDELVVSPFRRSIFAAVERAPFGIVRFTRIWVENIRDGKPGLARHDDFVVRKRGRAAREVWKKWALNPRRSWLGTWRAQPWTHRVFGWFNLSGSSVDFYGYHFIGISNSWYWDRTKMPEFDPERHERDGLLVKVFADVFGPRLRPPALENRSSE